MRKSFFAAISKVVGLCLGIGIGSQLLYEHKNKLLAAALLIGGFFIMWYSEFQREKS